MRWFGESWGAPVCATGDHVPTPVGSHCEHCAQLFEEDDQGLILECYERTGTRDFSLHIDCLLAMVEG